MRMADYLYANLNQRGVAVADVDLEGLVDRGSVVEVRQERQF